MCLQIKELALLDLESSYQFELGSVELRCVCCSCDAEALHKDMIF